MVASQSNKESLGDLSMSIPEIVHLIFCNQAYNSSISKKNKSEVDVPCVDNKYYKIIREEKMFQFEAVGGYKTVKMDNPKESEVVPDNLKQACQYIMSVADEYLVQGGIGKAYGKKHPKKNLTALVDGGMETDASEYKNKLYQRAGELAKIFQNMVYQCLVLKNVAVNDKVCVDHGMFENAGIATKYKGVAENMTKHNPLGISHEMVDSINSCFIEALTSNHLTKNKAFKDTHNSNDNKVDANLLLDGFMSSGFIFEMNENLSGQFQLDVSKAFKLECKGHHQSLLNKANDEKKQEELKKQEEATLASGSNKGQLKDDKDPNHASSDEEESEESSDDDDDDESEADEDDDDDDDSEEDDDDDGEDDDDDGEDNDDEDEQD